MMNVACLNGEYLSMREAVIPANDRGVLYGMGLFETIRVHAGNPVWIHRHLSRLFASAKELDLEIPFHSEQIAVMLNQTAQKNNMNQGALRLTITGGGATNRPCLFITGRSLPYRHDQYRDGIRAGFSTIKRNQHSPLIRHKTLNYFENMMAKRQAQTAGWDEALMVNTSGKLAEGSMSNVFAVEQGKVITPSLGSGVLPGITRDWVMKICSVHGIDIQEREISPWELDIVNECFISNSLMGVLPVTHLEETVIGSGVPGEVTRLIMAEIEKALEKE